ncbi:MAG TPA: imidazole glycerol phosphate synthase subunit HisH, partial [Methylomirabilota bacterium]|nr:imidazole glycerol phosphate synthase subunit HisH [Methylomirabilota bacterium]
MIAVVDYGRGNLGSVEKAFERVGTPAVVTRDPRAVDEADAVVLPGDGAFHDAMSNLAGLGLMDAMRRAL